MAEKQTVNLPDGNIATFPADWTPGMIQSKLWDTFPQWRPQGPVQSFSQWDPTEGQGNLAVQDYPSYDAYLAEREDQRGAAEADVAERQHWMVPPAHRGTPMLSELRPMMERVAQEWGIRLVTGDELRKANPGAGIDADALAEASNKATIGKVRDEALRRLERMKTGEAIRAVGTGLAPGSLKTGLEVSAAVASGEAQGAVQEFGVGLGQSLTDPVNLAAIGASVAGGPLAAIPIWTTFAGMSGGQAAGSIAGGAPLQQQLSETAMAAAVVGPGLHPKARAGLRGGINEIATDVTNLRRYLAPATVRAAGGTATPAPAPATTPPTVAVTPAPRPPLAQLGTAIEAVNNASLSVAESGTVPFASVNRTLTNLRAQLEAARRAARVSGARTAATGQQPTEAATGALEAGQAAPGAAADAAYAAAKKAIDDATAAVLRNQAGVVDAQQASAALSAAAAAASGFHIAIGGPAPKPEQQPYEAPAPLPRRKPAPAPSAWSQLTPDQKLEALAQKAADPAAGRFTPFEDAFLGEINKDPALHQRFLARQAELKAQRAAGIQPAAPAAQPEGGPSASSQQEAAAVHGNLRPQPGQGPGQVPTTQGGGGVQPQAQGELRQQAPTPAPEGLATTPPTELTETKPPPEPPPYEPPPAIGTILELDLQRETVPSLQRFTQRDLLRLAQREGSDLKATATKAQLAQAALKHNEFFRRTQDLDFDALQIMPKDGLQYLLRLIDEDTTGIKAALADRIIRARENLTTIRQRNLAETQRYYGVRDALRRGEEVPQDVIDQYPELRREGAEPTVQREPQAGPTRQAPLSERWSGLSDEALNTEYRAFRGAYETKLLGRELPAWEVPPSGASLPGSQSTLARQLRAMELEFDRRGLGVPWERRMRPPFKLGGQGPVHESLEPIDPEFMRWQDSLLKLPKEELTKLHEDTIAKMQDVVLSDPAAYKELRKQLSGIQRAFRLTGAGIGAGAQVLRFRSRDPIDDRGPARGDPPDIARQAANQLYALGGPGGPPHGLPPGVNPGPPNFAAQLMEASRRMNKLIRSSTTLPPKVQGRYLQTIVGDHIEVNNVRNQRVEAHEITHGLDAELFPTQFALPLNRQSQQSLVDRVAPHGVTGVTKAELFRQLASVSELMRGPLNTAYRRRASELIADWGSLYLHDPLRARAMAPDWTRGFETALALPRHADLLETVQQLHRQQVEPVPGQLGPGVSSVISQATTTPGVVGIRKTPPPPPHLLDIAIASQRYVKDAFRTLAAEEQRARVWGDHSQRLVKDEFQRKTVGAFVEGSGNIEKQGDDIGAVKARMTQPMKNLAMDFRHRIEYERQKLNYYLKGIDEPSYLAYLKDYLPHFYVQNEQYGASLSKFLKDSPNAKARIIPSLEEARRMGFTPITQDPTVVYQLYNRINWRVATNRRLVEEINRLRTPDGQPVVLPASVAPDNWIPLENQPMWTKFWARRNTEGKTLLWKGDMKAHPDVYYAIRQVLNYPISTPGKVYDAVNSFTRGMAFSLSGFHDVSLSFASLGTQFRWFAHPNPARGLIRLMERDPVTGHRVPFQFTNRAGEKLLQIEDAVADAAQHGLRFAWTDSSVFEYTSRSAVDEMLRGAEKLPGFKYYAPLQRALRAAVKWRQEGLWSKTHDALKMMAYHDIVLKALPRLEPGVEPSLLKERVASYLNDAFGGQDWQTHFWASPQVRRAWGRFTLAPDWTLSTIRSVPFASDIATAIDQRFLKAPPPGNYEGWPRAPRIKGMDGNLLRLKFWGAEVAAVLTTSMAMQWAIARMFGDPQEGDHLWMHENEGGAGYLGDARYTVDITPIMRKLERNGTIKALQDVPIIKQMVPEAKYPTRQYMNMGKRASEAMRWFMDPLSNIEAKVSRPVAELVKQLSGREGAFAAEWAQDQTTPELGLRLKSIAKNFVPFSFTGNQFVLTQPTRKGMTRFKAQEAFEGIYEMIADPSTSMRWLRAWGYGRPRLPGMGVTNDDLQSMMAQVADAAERNGINPEEPLTKARTKVMSYHQAAFTTAMVKMNEAALAGDKHLEERYNKIMEEQAEYLQRLGFTAQGIKASLKNQLRMHIPPKPADVTQPAPAP